MRTGSSHDRLVALAENAAFLILALALSFLESLIPLPLPLPGVKLGLSHLAVMLAARRNGLIAGVAVSAGRALLSAMLFGSVSSLAFSLGGAAASLLSLACLLPLYGRRLSWIGISASGAAAHVVGQLAVAALWMHESAVLSFLPVLLLAAALSGTLTGILANMLSAYLPPKEKRSVS